ncbi:putative sister chromatid cohesion protein Dcc1 [Helianthus annuus]|nr:putative sister chromatid cohesion protein Dcc1 [Helianthus annuus]
MGNIELDEFKKHVSNQRLKEAAVAVIKVAPGSMEFVRLEKLKKLLLENPYTSGEMPDCGLYRWDDLKREVPDEEELASALRVLSAVEINGYWRFGWTLSSLDKIELVESLVDWGFSKVVAHHCFQLYGRTTYGGGWEMDTTRVSLHVARRILANGKMKIGAFMEEWARHMPVELPLSLDILQGEVLVEQSSLYLPSDRFPGYFKNGPNGIGRIYTLTSVFRKMH